MMFCIVREGCGPNLGSEGRRQCPALVQHNAIMPDVVDETVHSKFPAI